MKTRVVLMVRAARLRETMPSDEEWISVYCTNCGRIEGARNVPELLPAIIGWRIAHEPQGTDMCPACRAEENGWAGSFPKRRTG